MIKTSIEEYKSENDLKIFLYIWEGSKNYFKDFPDVIEEIQNQLRKYKIKLIYVCGLDLFTKCRSAFYENVIAVYREPYKKAPPNNIENRNIYVVKDEKTEPLSSTDIRMSYQNNEEENIRKKSFSKVAEMLINFY